MIRKNIYGKNSSNKPIIGLNRLYCGCLIWIALLSVCFDGLNLHYLVPIAALAYVFTAKSLKTSGRFLVKISFLFFAFLFLQITSLSNNFTLYSIKNILSVAAIFMLVYTIISAAKILETKQKNICLYAVLSATFCIFVFVYPESFTLYRNTLPGGLLFLSCLLFVLYSRTGSNEASGVEFCLIFFASLVPTLLVSFILACRTAIFAGLIILSAYFVFNVLGLSSKTMKRLFVCLAAAALCLIYVYIELEGFDCFSELNLYSRLLFEKNINSGRGKIWHDALYELRKANMLVGLGSGALPTQFDGSFHNSFIQILIQNGIIGLGLIMLILREFWLEICKIKACKLRNVLLAIFVGIVVYDCFECCLTQNKLRIGFIQWIIISQGIVFYNKERLMVGAG